jgi:hypothetical protein
VSQHPAGDPQFLAVKAVALECAGRMDEALEVLEETLSMSGY